MRHETLKQAKISEIFLSYQGEGPFTGSRQLFVRFYGCNLNCIYCDTFLESYKTFSREGLLAKILDFEDDYNELSLTGGEPLLEAAFLRGFLPLFKKHRKHRIYLETNGTLPDELGGVIDDVDIIAMDFKLPSSGGEWVGSGFASSGISESRGAMQIKTQRWPWEAHERFIKIASRRKLIVKAVITDSTVFDDIKQMSRLLTGLKKECEVVLQPVTPVNDRVKEPDREMIFFFKGFLKKETGKEVSILGQAHKCLGVK